MSDLPALAPPDFDPATAYPEINSWRNAVVACDWPAISSIFAELPDASARTFAARIIGEIDGSELFLEELAAKETSSTLPRLLWASRLIETGWRVRSGARAKFVSREQFSTFHDHLRRAERILIEVTAYEPDNVSAWTLRLITARGLGLGQAEARRRYDRAASHAPDDLGAQTQMLQQLCPKWTGSFDRMHAFARDRALAAPEGALNATLIPEGHLEQWLDLDDAGGAEYLRQPHVQQQVQEAAARSVLNRAYRPTFGWVRVHNTFAMFYSLVGDYAAAAQHFRAVDNLATELPWGYYEDPAGEFQRHRAAALAKG